jgi:hypothetical protein
MAKNWWQNEDKGRPIAVATPVPGTATAVPVGGADHTTHIATAPYYVPAPNGHHQPQTIGPMDAQIYKMQSMGHRTQAHKTFLMFNIMAGFTGVNNVVAQCIAITYKGDLQMEIVLRFYMIGFCILVVLNEMEKTQIIRESLVLSNWVGRGIFYSFLGVLGQNLYDVGYDNRYRRNGYYGGSSGSSSSSSNRSGDYNGYYGPRMPSSEDFAEWYIWMTSFLLFFIGVIYLIMGACCLQRKLNLLRAQYQQSAFVAAQQRGAKSSAPWWS